MAEGPLGGCCCAPGGRPRGLQAVEAEQRERSREISKV